LITNDWLSATDRPRHREDFYVDKCAAKSVWAIPWRSSANWHSPTDSLGVPAAPLPKDADPSVRNDGLLIFNVLPYNPYEMMEFWSMKRNHLSLNQIAWFIFEFQ